MIKEDVLIGVFGLIFIFSLIMFVSQSAKMTGYATSATTISNVTITTYFSIAMCTNLSGGIMFGSVASLPATDQNASHNYDGVNTTPPSPGTSMCMNVSTDSNTAVNFCVNGSAALTSSGGDTIGLGNETYANNTVTNSTLPALGSQVALTTSYVASGYNITQGNSNYYRFWLDIPAATPAGTYNNTVAFIYLHY